MKSAKRIVLGTALLLALGSAGRLHAQASQTKPAAADPDDSLVLKDVLPEVNFNGVSLEDFVAFLRDVSPKFQVVIVRERNAPRDYPAIRLHLKNVPINQLLEVLARSYQGLEVSSVNHRGGGVGVGMSSSAPVYIMRVRSLSSAGGRSPGGSAETVKVYPLEGALASILSRPQAEGAKPLSTKAALDQTLSLINATLSEAGDEPPTLKVHEETLTLIFRGTGDQQSALEDALTALGARPQSRGGGGFGGSPRSVTLPRSAEAPPAPAKMDGPADLSAQVQALEQRVADLKRELDAANRAPRTTPGGGGGYGGRGPIDGFTRSGGRQPATQPAGGR